MRKPVPAFGSRTLRATTVALLAGVAAACSNASRIDQPIPTGGTPNQRAIIGGASAPWTPTPVETAAVTRSQLPPPGQVSGPATAGYPAPTLPDADGYAWTAVGGQVISVGANETLDAIAVKYGVPPSQILLANQLTSAAQVRSGSILVIPRRVGITPETAPTQVALQPRPANAPPGGSYVVRSGDTLYGIAQRSGVTVDALAAANGLSSTQIIVGQSLRLPGAAAPQVVASVTPRLQAAPVPQTAPGLAGTAARPTIPPVPAIPVDATPTTTPVSVTSAIDDADPPSANGTTFRWPVRGRIISGFGAKPNGERNDGINLSVPEGTSVKAVEAGTVIYAGNELEGYGNLILVRHADGWVSAYAHNRDLLVERGDEVRRGQTIAQAGMSGSVSAPQVHFELRKGSKPVNPLDYLTG